MPRRMTKWHARDRLVAKVEVDLLAMGKALRNKLKLSFQLLTFLISLISSILYSNGSTGGTSDLAEEPCPSRYCVCGSISLRYLGKLPSGVRKTRPFDGRSIPRAMSGTLV
jgi:hypothetical protein